MGFTLIEKTFFIDFYYLIRPNYDEIHSEYYTWFHLCSMWAENNHQCEFLTQRRQI